ncbi:MAG TPA: TIGR04283 family arsenosugar biosynthesis glycosyltransferase [Pseudolabrys sp.]|nr:TIGR04283 family arsenosugar biosynthesis glycosyltransferase [Pseudolabrys sp.]
MKLSIIMPALNEAEGIEAALRALAPLQGRGAEIIVVDGGSSDGTPGLAGALADRVITASRGRATQMNAGAEIATGDVFLFLHADTRLPENADNLIRDGIARPGHVWGRFDVRIDGSGVLKLVGTMMNWRSRLTGIATGDQAMFMTRKAFDAVGGFPPIALMEDIAMSRALKRISAPLCLHASVLTSGRRWKTQGILTTVVLMWRLRLSYFFGADPAKLARAYGYVPGDP